MGTLVFILLVIVLYHTFPDIIAGIAFIVLAGIGLGCVLIGLGGLLLFLVGLVMALI